MNEQPISLWAERQSDFWWLALARRVAIWSLAGAFLWAIPGFLLFALPTWAFVMWETLHPPDIPYKNHEGMGILVAFALIIVTTALSAIFGAIAGGISGYYAPAKDLKNPFKSRFFRRVHRETFGFWLLLTAISVGLAFFLLQRFFGGPICFALCVSISLLGFVLGVWRATNRAMSCRN